MNQDEQQLSLWDVPAPAEDAEFAPFAHLPDPDEDRQLLTLRDYQVAATDETWRLFHVEHFQRLLGVAAMGAGKTVMFADLARREVQRGGKALVLVDQDELVGQAVERIRETTGILADIEQASRRASLGSRVVVSTVQTMRSRLEKWPGSHFGLVVADEADRSLAEQWSRVLTHFDKDAKTLGVTATPNRADRKSLMTYFQKKAFDIALTYLIERGFLSRIKVRTVPLKIDVRSVKQKAGDYDKAELGAALRPYFGQICDALLEFAADRKVADLPPARPHVEGVRPRSRSTAGSPRRHVDGESAGPPRDPAGVPGAGVQRTLSNALLLSRGYDDPSIDCVVNLQADAPPHDVRADHRPRGTRIWCPERCPTTCEHEGRKKDLLVLDFLWMFERFDIMRPAALIAKDSAREKKMSAKFAAAKAQLDLMDVEAEASLEHERELLEQFEKAAKRKARGTYFDALEWAAMLRIPNLIDWEPETEEDLEEMTKGQASRLTKAGFVVGTVRGRRHAEKIIEVLDGRMRAGLATFKQVHWLRKFGVDDAMEKTKDEATAILDEHFGSDKKKWWFRRRKYAPLNMAL
jgi:type I site-specific restriction endonuclease